MNQNDFARKRAPRRSWKGLAPFALLAFVAVLFSSLLFAVMFSRAERLVRLGLVGNVYYIIVVSLGVAVAASLFGILKSYSAYSGTVFGGNLVLGGPVVVFFGVVILGFVLVPNPSPFGITLFVHGEAGSQEIVLRNEGNVLLDLDGDRRREPIGDRGQAYFTGIPSTFRGQAVAVLIDVNGYELVNPRAKITLDSNSVYVAVRPKAIVLTGYVTTPEGQPIIGATVNCATYSAKTGMSGFFRIAIPSAAVVRESMSLHVHAHGYAPWHGLIIPGGHEISVQLRREK